MDHILTFSPCVPSPLIPTPSWLASSCFNTFDQFDIYFLPYVVVTPARLSTHASNLQLLFYVRSLFLTRRYGRDLPSAPHSVTPGASRVRMDRQATTASPPAMGETRGCRALGHPPSRLLFPAPARASPESRAACWPTDEESAAPASEATAECLAAATRH
jgi:hypothetical protein